MPTVRDYAHGKKTLAARRLTLRVLPRPAEHMDFKKWHDENAHDWLNLHCAMCGATFDEGDNSWCRFDIWTHRCPDGRSGTVARKEWPATATSPCRAARYACSRKAARTAATISSLDGQGLLTSLAISPPLREATS